MNLKDINDCKILISALDWGFGHTTRTSVLIKQLIKQNNAIVFAGDSNQIGFIKKEFSEVDTEVLAGYEISLNSNANTYFQILKQIPKILSSIKTERTWVQKKISERDFDLIISDNRYGFYNSNISSIIVTHQTSLQIPLGKRLVNYFLRKQLNKFSTCWIPDFKNHALSGNLSNGKLKISTFFIGPLSRFVIKDKPEYKYDYLFLVSGPLPERDVFFEKIIKFISSNKLNAAIAVPFKLSKTITATYPIIEHPDSSELELLINSSKTIVSKSGYTTIMDFIPFKKQMILLATEKQFEQQYLSSYHQLKNVEAQYPDLDFSKLL